jgi:hypothetical protein
VSSKATQAEPRKSGVAFRYKQQDPPLHFVYKLVIAATSRVEI